MPCCDGDMSRNTRDIGNVVFGPFCRNIGVVGFVLGGGAF